MIAYKDSVDDMNRKYAQTFVLYHGVLCQINEFGPRDDLNGDITIYYASEEGSYNGLFKEDELESIFFDSLMFNMHKLHKNNRGAIAATTIFKSPKKQYQRSISHQNVILDTPAMALYNAFGKRMLGWTKTLTWPHLNALLDLTYPSIEDATDKLDDFCAIAVSQHYALCLSSVSLTKPLVSGLFGFIGELDVENKVFEIHHKPAFQEVKDFVKRSHQTHYTVMLCQQ